MLYLPLHRNVLSGGGGGREGRREGKRERKVKMSKATGRIKLYNVLYELL